MTNNLCVNKNVNIVKLYKGTVELVFDSAKHRYTVEGKVVDGVTSVLRVIDKPALLYWGVNKAAEYIQNNLPVGKPIDEIEKQKLINGCKSAHRQAKEDAGDLGTILHDLIEKYAKGLPYKEPINDILKRSFNSFREWVADRKIIFKSSERKIYSRKYGYAGTLDLTANYGDENVIIDIKTSSGIWPEQWLQLAAYRQALREEFPKLKISRAAIVRCGKDGAFEVEEADDFKKNITAFLGALDLYRRLKEMKETKRSKK